MPGRKITLRYSGRCIHCGRTIPAGVEAYWQKGTGVWHIDCQLREFRSMDSSIFHGKTSETRIPRPQNRSLDAELTSIALTPSILFAIVLFLWEVLRTLPRWMDVRSNTFGFIAYSCGIGLIILVPLTISSLVSVATYWMTGKVYYVIPHRGTPSRPWRPVSHKTRRYYQLRDRSRKTSR